MAIEWALVRSTRDTSVSSSAHGHDTTAEVRENYSSVQCWSDDRVGSILREGEIDETDLSGFVESALKTSTRGSIPPTRVSATPDSSPPELQACGFLATVGTISQRWKTWLDAGVAPPWLTQRTSSGTWCMQGLRGVHHATVPIGAPIAGWSVALGSDVHREAMLFSPAMLGRLLGEDISGIVLADGLQRRTPRCSIESLPDHHGVDLEGVASVPLTLRSGSTPFSPPTTITQAARSRRTPSGHVGPYGPVPNRLVVGRDGIVADPTELSYGWIVEHARLLGSAGLAKYIVASTDLDGRHYSRIRWLPSAAALLDEGVWVGPWQAGGNGWVSRWLSVPPRKRDEECLQSWP